ncbi:T9SS type A sorting domain-containing protein [Subsaximicrobium wynnwilliamsii]|uniref:T9SS type A sorting domain-containing protein n=1 Tax=Subsaximicrobium wynnwilliamsii TaxID=291179 RepID=A0A5C6ZNN7_9FLAO|nr:T9SS type A sorting domain-containing protein [Subsaximicrobium wynnwilliamsii]TXD90300.1 T9SS type A sorting domain-containing protein [Subsaximicrobium wynnwilliamsii]
MKHVLLIFTLFCASYMTVNAQTNTWTGAGANTNWNTVANWSLNAMPTAANDVVIPTGFTVNLNVAGDTKSIVVQGNSTFNMSNTLSILNASSVAANATCAWTLGSLTGGGTLTNNGTFNLSSGNTKSIVGVTTFNNTGNFNILDGGDLNITDGIFNNLASGIIDLRGNEGNISYTGSASRILNNAGLIKSTATGGNVRIQTVLNNNGGAITVSNGNLIFDFLDKNLNGGVLNVSVGSVLRLTSTTNLTGTLTGALNGDLEWSGNVSSAGTSTFNFSGSSGVRWTAGNLTGGGTLVNKNLIFLSSGNTKSIIGVTTLNNEGDFNIPDGGDFNITDGIFNNQLTGTIDMQWAEGNISYTGSASRILNNAGLIKSTATGGNVRIQTVLNNNGGTITVSNGNLIFDTLDKNLNGGVLNVSVGSVLRLTSTTNLTGTLTGALNGDLEWSGNVSSAGTSTFNFSGSSGVRWTAGNLTGGGTLVKKNLIFLSSGNTKSIIGATTLNNEGDFNITDGGDFNITDGIFNNQLTGTIDMQWAEGNISYTGSASRILNNAGLIKSTATGGNVRIQTVLNNNGGTITVSNGNLIFDFLDKNLNGGMYNVSVGSSLQWNSNTVISGTLTGNLTGEIDWLNDITIPNATTGTFNFTGNSGVKWSSGNLTGGGTLVNKSLIFLRTANTKSIIGATTLNNEGDFNITDGGDFNITDGIFNNQSAGTIDMQGAEGNISYTGSASRILNNFGMLKRTTTAGNARIHTFLNNSGSIDAQAGTLVFSEFLAFTNDEEGVVKGVSTVTIANTANYTNNGTFSPGGSPGTLTFNGVFKSSTTSVLDVELNGLTSGTQYDVLAITGTNAIFDGDVNVTLGFEPVVGNTFTVATTTGTITTKSLATPFTSDYLGKRYTFNVTYPNDNVVRLTISNILDIEAPNVITQNATVQLNASGNGSITAAQINNGSSDNCSLVADLTYTLSKSTFNCSNLGANTVTLTVTDEAGNSANQTATVTVVDAINPTVTCGGDSTIDSNGNYALPNYVTNSTASASDNCSATVVQAPVAGTSLADGTYTISFVATDSSGNTANCSFSLTVVDTTLGIDDFELSESSIQLYPNPVGNVLTIKNVNNLELDNAQITDVTGKVITTFDLKNMGLTKEISLEDLSSGMYFLKINGLNSSVTKRVIKQ